MKHQPTPDEQRQPTGAASAPSEQERPTALQKAIHDSHMVLDEKGRLIAETIWEAAVEHGRRGPMPRNVEGKTLGQIAFEEAILSAERLSLMSDDAPSQWSELSDKSKQIYKDVAQAILATVPRVEITAEDCRNISEEIGEAFENDEAAAYQESARRFNRLLASRHPSPSSGAGEKWEYASGEKAIDDGWIVEGTEIHHKGQWEPMVQGGFIYSKELEVAKAEVENYKSLHATNEACINKQYDEIKQLRSRSGGDVEPSHMCPKIDEIIAIVQDAQQFPDKAKTHLETLISGLKELREQIIQLRKYAHWRSRPGGGFTGEQVHKVIEEVTTQCLPPAITATIARKLNSLRASHWILVGERMPTIEDADRFGLIEVCFDPDTKDESEWVNHFRWNDRSLPFKLWRHTNIPSPEAKGEDADDEFEKWWRESDIEHDRYASAKAAWNAAQNQK